MIPLVIILMPIMMQTTNTDSSEVKTRLLELFGSAQGTYAVAAWDLRSDRTILINEHEVFHAASTMKTPVMIEVYRQAREGKFRLDDSIRVRNEFKSIVDGSPYQLDLGEDSDDSVYRLIGQKTTIRDLVHHMITVSSNLATNVLMDLVGATQVTATMRTLGAPDIQVLRGVEDMKAFERGMSNTTTAYDLMMIYHTLARRAVVDSAASEEMLGVLLDQKFNELIPAQLPAGTRVAHKTGSITGVLHDSGIVVAPDGSTYVVVLLSKDLPDFKTGRTVLAEASRIIYEDFVTKH